MLRGRGASDASSVQRVKPGGKDAWTASVIADSIFMLLVLFCPCSSCTLVEVKRSSLSGNLVICVLFLGVFTLPHICCYVVYRGMQTSLLCRLAFIVSREWVCASSRDLPVPQHELNTCCVQLFPTFRCNQAEATNGDARAHPVVLVGRKCDCGAAQGEHVFDVECLVARAGGL